jgi:cytochrome c-type biogenesis protein CcmF
MSISLRRASGLPRSAWGTMFAHAALGVTLIGIVCESTWNSEYIAAMKPGDSTKLAGYEFKFEGANQRQGPNYRELLTQFTVTENGRLIGGMAPSKRSFITRGSSTTEAALLTRGFSQLYVSLGDINEQGAVTVRIYHKPMVLLIWFGPILMALGGLLSLSDRRLRVGAPKPAKAPRVLQPAE